MRKKQEPPKKKLAGPMSRLSSQKHQDRAAKAAEPSPKPLAPVPMLAKRVDPLAAVVAKREEHKRIVACLHKHMRFNNNGGIITCIDCPLRWHVLMPGGGGPGGVPDVTYFNLALNELETRHTPFEAPRSAPLPPPPKNK